MRGRENQRERERRRNRSCTRAQETWLYFRASTTRGGEFLSPGVASSPAISPRRKLRKEYQHATQRRRCGDFSPRFRIYEAASFLTSGHEKRVLYKDVTESRKLILLANSVTSLKSIFIQRRSSGRMLFLLVIFRITRLNNYRFKVLKYLPLLLQRKARR